MRARHLQPSHRGQLPSRAAATCQRRPRREILRAAAGHHPPSPSVGFTLSDLVITLGIMAIMAAVAVPRYLHSVDFARVEGAAGIVRQQLEELRDYATAAGRPVSVVISPSSHSLSIEAGDSLTAKSVHLNLNDPPWFTSISELRINDEISMSATVLEFNAVGRPSAEVELTLRAGEIQRRIHIPPNVRPITIEDGRP